ncbi:MAG: protocatechuate 3,4-dioxygenase [Betaproteobacteria bacterium]
MPIIHKRRQLLITAAGAAASSLIPVWALEKTPSMTEGPFYPRLADITLDDDNDLTRVKGKEGVARGTLLDLTGQVIDSGGKAAAGASVEIWQCNSHGRYHDARDVSSSPIDPFFQGFGKSVTDAGGRFRFRTIRPVAYPGRVPHIHFKVKSKAFRELTTQMFVAGDPGLEEDFIWRSLRGVDLKKQMASELKPAATTGGAALAGFFDIMLA